MSIVLAVTIATLWTILCTLKYFDYTTVPVLAVISIMCNHALGTYCDVAVVAVALVANAFFLLRSEDKSIFFSSFDYTLNKILFSD